ncbi:MucR family transcriptional regulator [Arvimicrobium flavum]|uniref:MucR family transcriptional regulator n=1 Tax=Arvimicrobium flavum TaxID=3393320 RepID=UPI00237AE7C9|nr:MucR family transcriptional regulator [Mesorhizobium shangrilense]
MKNLLELTAEIVSAYVGKNSIPVAELPKVIADVSAAITMLGSRQTAAEVENLKPAVNPRRSVFPDYIISLETGQRFKSLKRHLMASHGMTPDQYREKWGLPSDYPMVAPNYAAMRSRLAKTAGLGRKPGVKLKRKAKGE